MSALTERATARSGPNAKNAGTVIASNPPCERETSAQTRASGSPGTAAISNFRLRVLTPAIDRIRQGYTTSHGVIVPPDPGFPKVTPHDLRHTAASLAISAGAHVKAVQGMLGHASATMTLDVYADLFGEDLDAVLAALGAGADADRSAQSSPPAVEAEVIPNLRDERGRD